MKKNYTKEIQNVISKFNLKKIFITLGGISGIILMFSFVIDFFGLHDWGKSKPSISQNEISIKYLDSNYDTGLDGVFRLFEDKIDNTKSYTLYEKCATQLFITNNYSHEIVLDKIYFIAEEIEIINEPVIDVSINQIDGSVGMGIGNSGWSDSGEIVLKFEGSSELLNDYINEEKLTKQMGNVAKGEYEYIKLWKNSDLKTDVKDALLYFDVTCKNSDGNVIDVRQGNSYDGGEISHLSVTIQDGKFPTLGLGANGNTIYGIKIDTSNNRYCYEDEIGEYIDEKETLGIPICFYPDKSCNLTFKIEFEVNSKGKKFKIGTESIKMKFVVSSIKKGDFSIKDINGCSDEEIQQDVNQNLNTNIVTFPYENYVIKN